MIGQRAEHGSSAEHAEPPGFEDWPEISRVETDRFCFRCGYNLHQQSVRRDPRTEVLVSRCPECGTFHHLVSWSMRYLAGSAGCYVAGGLLAMLIGRGLARLIVRIVVPPRWRVYLEGISPRAN